MRHSQPWAGRTRRRHRPPAASRRQRGRPGPVAAPRGGGIRGSTPLPRRRRPGTGDSEADIEGEAAIAPYPEWSMQDDTLVSVARPPRSYHDAVRTFDSSRRRWASTVPGADRRGLLSHNDPNLDNIIFRDGKVVAPHRLRSREPRLRPCGMSPWLRGCGCHCATRPTSRTSRSGEAVIDSGSSPMPAGLIVTSGPCVRHCSEPKCPRRRDLSFITQFRT